MGGRQAPVCHVDCIKWYVENNPLKAGLVANAEDYLWSSASRKAEMNLGSAGCAGHVQQLGSESLLPNLMEVKG